MTKLAPSPSDDSHPFLNAIVAQLEEEIIFGQLHPNERLIEDELMMRFGAKRHVVRKAFDGLEALGIVERAPNKGARVKAFSREDVIYLYQMREMLETQAASVIPLPLAASDMERLRTAQGAHDEAVASRDLRRVFRANMQFHRVLFDLVGNPFLKRAINDFAGYTHALRFCTLRDFDLVRRSQAEHHAMLEALQRADRAALVELCRQHLIPARDMFLNQGN